MYTTEKYLFDCKNLVSNPSARVPVCLCLDVSGSMDGLPIQELNEGVRQFYQAIKEDETALYAADICVITFGGTEPVCLRDFSGLDQQPEVPTLSAGGMTPMGEAINLGLDLLEHRKEQFRSVGVDYFQPWFVLMSDGAPNGAADQLARAKQRMDSLAKAVRFSNRHRRPCRYEGAGRIFTDAFAAQAERSEIPRVLRMAQPECFHHIPIHRR